MSWYGAGVHSVPQSYSTMPGGFFIIPTIFIILFEGGESFNQRSSLVPSGRFSYMNGVYYIKLSPVPFEVEEPEYSSGPDGMGAQYEVFLAPSAPSNNFILHPIQQGSHQPSSVFPQQPYGINGSYYINQQGYLVHRPGTMKPLDFHEAPPAFPNLTDEQLLILGQPLTSHYSPPGGISQSNTGPVDDLPETSDQRPWSSTLPMVGNSPVLLSPSPSLTEIPVKPTVQNQPGHQSQAPSTTSSQYLQASQQILPPPQQHTQQPFSQSQHLQATATKPSAPGQQLPSSVPQSQISSLPATESGNKNPNLVQSTPQQHPVNISPPLHQPSQIKAPGGVYIATVNNKPGRPSTVFTCHQTHLIEPALLLAPAVFTPGPKGYSCKVSKGRPFLSNFLLAANGQTPVKQPTVSTKPVLLPTIIPIPFS